jgi:PPOX class probable F420-dependent enzyme
MTTLDDAVRIGARDQFLAVVSTARADGSIQSSLVNAGALAHPATGSPVLGFVTYGTTKLRNLRARPQLTATFRAGWEWASIEGVAELIGPDDPHPSVARDALPALLRDIFTAAGGTHGDWDAYDREMVATRRAAVLLEPRRIYSNR